ncbi:MAG: hypothetical protein KY443_01490 [Actinobacteria bacterium]|nr:hypothetical protein [Actinomycetota bacterium]
MRFRTAAAAALIVVVTGACGGGGDKHQAASDGGNAASETTSTTAAPGTATSTPSSGLQAPGAPGGAGSTPTTAASGSAASTGGAASSNDITKVGNPEDFPVPLSIEELRPCVRPGQPQTVVLRSERETHVGYDSVYSDGQNSMSAGNNYYGGSNSGETGPGTEWRDTFVVKVGAPAGEVRVNAIAANKRGVGRATTTFRVADASGNC